MPHPVYLNNAATSFPKPPPLGKEVCSWLDALPFHAGRSGAPAKDPLQACRQKLAGILGTTDPERIALSRCATESLNIALHGLGLKNQAVIASRAEHNSVLRPLFRLRRLGMIDLHLVPCDGQGRAQREEWLRLTKELRPALAVLTHASNVTGAVNPISELFSAVHEFGGKTLLDASQTAGLLRLDVGELQADLLAFTGHKYLLGPTGTGGLYVRPGIDLDPLLTGGTGVRSELQEMPPEMPMRLEAGTPATPLFAGLAACLDWQEQHPLSRPSMDRSLIRLEEGMRQAGAQVIAVTGPRTPIISFTLPGWETADVGLALEKGFGIICRTGLHCAPLVHESLGTLPAGTVRFSLSRFTTDNEVDAATDAVRRMIHGPR